jgi:hypothetical protein
LQTVDNLGGSFIFFPLFFLVKKKKKKGADGEPLQSYPLKMEGVVWISLKKLSRQPPPYFNFIGFTFLYNLNISNK